MALIVYYFLIMKKKHLFNDQQLSQIKVAASHAEELVSDEYKLTSSQWLKHTYELKTMRDLLPEEIVDVPFAQLIRYRGQKKETHLGSYAYDFYKICIQDHNIITTIKKTNDLKFYPFMLYVISHELIHIIRFSKFLQNFQATEDEKLKEEKRVHKKTHSILKNLSIDGIDPVINFKGWWL